MTETDNILSALERHEITPEQAMAKLGMTGASGQTSPAELGRKAENDYLSEEELPSQTRAAVQGRISNVADDCTRNEHAAASSAVVPDREYIAVIGASGRYPGAANLSQ